MFALDDTIAAIASAAGGAARGIIRISGSDTLQCLVGCFPVLAERLPRARRPHVFTSSLNIAAGRAIHCEIYFWPSHRSYTRQPSAELHLIGSPPLLQRVLDAVCASGARIANPGEFTMRAFLAGRIDLTQAEAVLGVIDARDRLHLEVALQQLAGGLSQVLHRLRERLLDLLAHLEAGLDFVDEDIEFISADQLRQDLHECENQIRQITQQMRERTVDSAEPRVVLRGAPNAGKSSLFNALLGRDAAIVSALAGTTRDYLTGLLQLGDYRCLLIDTAGHEDHSFANPVQRTAQQLMHEQTSTAELEIMCLDGARPVNDWELQLLSSTATNARIVVQTKADLGNTFRENLAVLRVSSTSGEGLTQLRSLIGEQIAGAATDSTSTVAATAARCREILHQAADHLSAALEIHRTQAGEELIAAELRLALDALGRVVGAIYTDDVLDRIFSRFCIGK